MSAISDSESPEHKILRLEGELQIERARADQAEAQLQRVQEGIRAFKEKQEVVIRARKAREAQALEEAERVAQEVPEAFMASSGVTEAWADPDPTLDDRLDKYLESSFEPDRSRNWMLKD